MAAAIGNLQDAFHAFLLSMSPEELTGLISRLHSTRDEAINPVQNPLENVAPLPSSAAPAPVVHSDPAPRTSSLRGKRPLAKKRRPLNSFIAFRSFYSVLFPDLTQKARSGILRFLWQNDPFKAKWAILAKAYSIIRDDHDGAVSVEQFLALNAPFIRIIEPIRYLEMMGWELSVDEEQQYTMAKLKTVTTIDTEISTNYSVDDVVRHCYDVGLVFETQRTRTDHPDGNGPCMAFAAQPNVVVKQNDNVEIDGSNNVVQGNFTASPEVEIPSMGFESVVSLPGAGDINPMMNNTQITDRNRVLPVQNNPMIQGFQGFGFDTMQTPGADNNGAEVDETYRNATETQNASETFDRVEFEQYLNFF